MRSVVREKNIYTQYVITNVSIHIHIYVCVCVCVLYNIFIKYDFVVFVESKETGMATVGVRGVVPIYNMHVYIYIYNNVCACIR